MRRFGLLSAIYFLLVSNAIGAESLVELETRPGVTQKLILLEPAAPVASVILFAGGKGALGLSSFAGSVGIDWGKNNFLVRARRQFAAHGFTVAVVDAPSDRQSSEGMLGGFRASREHVQDIDAVIRYLRSRADVPVWLVGTSRGTESVAYAAIQSRERPRGIVLSSSMTVENSRGVALTEMPLERIAIPVLVVAHRGDACGKTPPEGASTLERMLRASPRVEVKLYDGGDPPRSGACRALSPHGFLGIEDEVVAEIAGFIRGH